MNKKKAIYPGSFDPITNGHIDIINRASQLFDELIIAVLNNSAKKSLFTPDERVNLIKDAVNSRLNINVVSYEGLLADFAQKKNVTHIVRGLRAISDFEYELEIALTNRTISNKKLDTIFFMTDEKNFFLSSSLVKEVSMFKGDVKNMVPANVLKALKRKFK